ncbi:MAG: hypothetical protein QOE23_1209 [Pseudonocardiales bacterium]|nr:hypothetical protein [Pseudonocardiales bacterium]
MPSDRFLKTMNGLHRALLTLTGGRLGASFGGMPTLELTTIGRRSGAPRSVLLTSPWQRATPMRWSPPGAVTTSIPPGF